MKLRLSTRFMKGIIAKIIKKTILKKCGYDIDILLNDIVIENTDGKLHLHADVDAEITAEEFLKIIKSIGID